MVAETQSRAARAARPMRLVCWTGALLLAPSLTGCATTTHDQLVAFLRSHEAEVGTGSYTVRAPDSIAIHAPCAQEIDGTTQLVRSDGRVTLRLLGEVDVAGLTPEEIARKLEKQLSRYYRDPEVIVEVASYASQHYYVFGEVTAPGPRPVTGRDTLLMALADARPLFTAWRSRIRVTRPGESEADAKTIVVDLEHMMKTGDLEQNILLQEGDIVEVPPTPLAWLGHRVRELLYPIDPMLDAYSKPATAISTTHTYEEEFGSGRDSQRDRQLLQQLRRR